MAFIGYAAALADNVALPAFQPGDVAIVVAAFNGATIPSLPAGWDNATTDPTTDVGAGTSRQTSRCGTRILQAGDTTTGVWTNAGRVQVYIHRDVALGAMKASSGTAATIATPAVTLAVGDGTSKVVGLASRRGATMSGTFSTAVLANIRSGGGGGVPAMGAADSGFVSSYSSENFASSGATGWAVHVIELKNALVAKSSSDTGTGTEGTPAIAVTAAAADTGAGTEGTPSVAATVAGTETGAGTDAGTIAAAVSTSDTGTGTEGTPSITAPIGGSDTGTGTEGTPSIAATVAGSETAAGAEAASIAAQVSGSDTGTGTDDGSLASPVGSADTGEGTEGYALTVELSSADTAALLAEAAAILAELQDDDEGVGAEDQDVDVVRPPFAGPGRVAVVGATGVRVSERTRGVNVGRGNSVRVQE